MFYQRSKLTPQDRGFRFGNGAFETIIVCNAKLFNLSAHIARINKTLGELDINYQVDNDLVRHLEQAAKKQKNGFVRLIISDDGSSRGYLATSDNHNIFIECVDSFDTPSSVRLEVSDITTHPKTSRVASGKTLSGINYVKARKQASKNGFDDCVMLNISGNIAETSSSNIFFVVGDDIFTPDIDSDIIVGTIRELVIDMFHVKQTICTQDIIEQADEVFITNVSHLACGVACIGKKSYSKNIITNRVKQRLEEIIINETN